jgi:hypothetical protein
MVVVCIDPSIVCMMVDGIGLVLYCFSFCSEGLL